MARRRGEYIYAADDDSRIPLPGMPIARPDGGIDVYQANGSRGTYPDHAAYDHSRAEAHLARKFDFQPNDPRVGGDAGYRDAYRARFGRDPIGVEDAAIPYSEPKNGLEKFVDDVRDDWRRGKVGPLTKSDLKGVVDLAGPGLAFPEIGRYFSRPNEAYAFGANRPTRRPPGAAVGRYYTSAGGKPYKPESNLYSAFRSGVAANGDDESLGVMGALANIVRAPFSDQVDFDPMAAYRLSRDFARDERAETRKQHPILAPVAELAGALVPLGYPLRAARLANQGFKALPIIGSAAARYARPIETAIASAIPAFNSGEGLGDSVKRSLTAAAGGAAVEKILRPARALARRNLPKPIIDRWTRLDRMTKRYGISPLPKVPTREEIRQQINDKTGAASRFVGGQIAKLYGKPGAVSKEEATGQSVGRLLGPIVPGGSLFATLLGGAIGRRFEHPGSAKRNK